MKVLIFMVILRGSYSLVCCGEDDKSMLSYDCAFPTPRIEYAVAK